MLYFIVTNVQCPEVHILSIFYILVIIMPNVLEGVNQNPHTFLQESISSTTDNHFYTYQLDQSRGHIIFNLKKIQNHRIDNPLIALIEERVHRTSTSMGYLSRPDIPRDQLLFRRKFTNALQLRIGLYEYSMDINNLKK